MTLPNIQLDSDKPVLTINLLTIDFLICLNNTHAKSSEKLEKVFKT